MGVDVGVAIAAAKAAAEAVKAIKTRDPKAKRALAGAQDLLITAQSSILELQETALSLRQELAASQEENDKLRAQVREKEKRPSEGEQYERKKIGRSWVVTPKGEDEPFLCATCFEAGRKVFLQPLPRDFRTFGTHRCSTCKASVTLRH